MISAPLEVSRPPAGPTSAIAPKLLVGTSPFPALLQASQTGIAGPPAPDLQENEGGSNIEQAVFDLSPEQTNDIGHPASLITPGPYGSPLSGQTGGRSLPQIGNLLPPEGSAQPLTAPSFPASTRIRSFEPEQKPGLEIRSPSGATSEGEGAGKESLAGRSTAQTSLPARASQSIAGPGLISVQGDKVVETATTHLPKNPESFDKSKIPDGREVSRSVKASDTGISSTRRPPQAPGNFDAASPADEAETAAAAVTRQEGRPLRSENLPPDRLANPLRADAADRGLVQRLDNRPVSASAVLQTLSRADRSAAVEETPNTALKTALSAGTRLDPEPRRSARPLADLAAGPRALPPILSNAEPIDAAAPSTAPSLPNGQPVAALAANAASLAAPSGVEPRAEVRPAQPIETVINQLAEARETARASRPELTLRHHEFGTINMRIETAGAELRATLASRDPGFVPAVQAALAERAVAASSESAPGQSSRSNDQGGNQNSSSQNSSSQGNSSGFGASSEGRYGSSPGSGQGSSQPYWGQSSGNEEDVMQHRSASAGADLNDAHGTGIFA